jgi:hypothetical protein
LTVTLATLIPFAATTIVGSSSSSRRRRRRSDDDGVDGDDGGGGGREEESYETKIASSLIPLALLAMMTIASFHPWRTSRSTFWSILSLTATAPFHVVTFRDGFVGDVLTSTVRPLQDLATAIFHLPYTFGDAYWGMMNTGWWGGGVPPPLPAPDFCGWLLHTVVLPGCTLSP